MQLPFHTSSSAILDQDLSRAWREQITQVAQRKNLKQQLIQREGELLSSFATYCIHTKGQDMKIKCLAAALLADSILIGTVHGAESVCTSKQVTNASPPSSAAASIDADGTRIAFVSRNDLTGANMDGNEEIFLYDDDTEAITQITDTTTRPNLDPSINADGARIAFASRNDLTGGNPDNNQEVFLYDAGAIIQVTSTSTSFVAEPSIDAAGTQIAFSSPADLTGDNPEGRQEIFPTMLLPGSLLKSLKPPLHICSIKNLLLAPTVATSLSEA